MRLGLTALALICAATSGLALRHPSVPSHSRADQDTMRVGPMQIEDLREGGVEAHLVGASPPEDHGYFQRGPEFDYHVRGIAGPSKSRRMIRARYLQYFPRQTERWTSDDYRFEWLDRGQPITLSVSSGLSKPLTLTPGNIYDLTLELHPGWPDAYGLIIENEGRLVFQGLTDWRVDGVVTTDSLSPIRVTQTRVMTDHWQETGDPCEGKTMNIEITFSVTGERLILGPGQSSKVVLHQGQSGRLGQYEINLLIARSIEYTGKCLDTGSNGISFTVTRLGEGQGVRPPPPLGDWFIIYLKPGIIDFPRTCDGYPSHLVVPADSVRFPRAIKLGEILDELGWAACEKTISTLREGDSIDLTTPYGRMGAGKSWTVLNDELISRAYTIYLQPDSLRPADWPIEAKRHLLESGYVDSVQFGPPPGS